MVSGSCRPSLVSLTPLLLAALAPLAGCEILLSRAECENLDEVCPNLQCDDYKQDRDGCSICECVAPDEPVVCFIDDECPAGQACDTVNFCEQDPGCVDGQDCPAVCYGRCVETAGTCTTDADCAADETCVPVGNARPAPEERPGGGDGGAAPAPPLECTSDADCGADATCQNGSCTFTVDTGVCLPRSCEDRVAIDLPACPPGTEATIDFSQDPCGVAVCVPVDGCRELDPDTCRNTPGCEVFLEDCCGGTEPANCDCAPFERCGPTDDCAGLAPDQCLQNPACELVDSGGTSGGGSDGGALCEVCDDQGNCRPCDADPIAPPPPEQICIPRQVQNGCLSDADCGPGERCDVFVSCATGCSVNPDTGEEICVDECWVEEGQCVPAANTCWDIVDPALCASTPGCELIEGADGGGAAPPAPCDPNDPDCSGELPVPVLICQPATTACLDDSECAEGQRCEIRETCAPCDPANGDDIGCLAPCFIEGQCVDGTPPPTGCTADVDCGPGGSCVTVDVCTDCAAPPDGEIPPPCEPTCTTENICVNETATCFVDADCSEREFCDFSQGCFASPTGLIACQGVCTAIEEPPPPDGSFCLTDEQCEPGSGCLNNDAICRDNPNSDIAACWGWCVAACGDALTPAMDPVTGQCVVFSDTCIPPEWQQVEACM